MRIQIRNSLCFIYWSFQQQACNFIYLIIQVQATRADEENRPSNGSGLDDEENEETNLIPFADVSHGDSEAGHETNPIPDKVICDLLEFPIITGLSMFE